MQFAEAFLRLGSSLVAWMMLYTHFLWLAALSALGCGPDGDEMHKLLLGLAPMTVGFALALKLTRPFADIHGVLRWLGAPLLLLLPFAIHNIWQVFQSVNLASLAICTDALPTGWQRLWVPVQLVVLSVSLYMMISVWRTGKVAAEDGSSA